MINVMPSSSIRILGIGEEYRVQDLLAAIDECETLRTRVKELEARLQVDPGGSDKIDELEQAALHLRARVAELESEITSTPRTFLRDECLRMNARIAELEAPPVVPEGWEVVDHCGLELRYDGQRVAYINGRGDLCVADLEDESVAPWPALVALEYAHRTQGDK